MFTCTEIFSQFTQVTPWSHALGISLPYLISYYVTVAVCIAWWSNLIMNVVGTSQKITLLNCIGRVQGVPNLWRPSLKPVFAVANNWALSRQSTLYTCFLLDPYYHLISVWITHASLHQVGLHFILPSITQNFLTALHFCNDLLANLTLWFCLLIHWSFSLLEFNNEKYTCAFSCWN